MSQALGPVFHLYGDDWENIRVATCLLMARVIQSTPHRGLEQSILAQSQQDIGHALDQFLKLEEEAVKAKEAARDRTHSVLEAGIEGFGALAPVNGNEAGPALVGEPAVVETPAKDFYDETNEGPSPEDIHDVQSAIEAEMERDAEADESRETEEGEDGYSPDGPRRYAL